MEESHYLPTRRVLSCLICLCSVICAEFLILLVESGIWYVFKCVYLNSPQYNLWAPNLLQTFLLGNILYMSLFDARRPR